MTKKLEEEFNLPPIEEAKKATEETETEEIIEQTEIIEVDDALSISDKINTAFKQIKNLDNHETEMDDIYERAIDMFEDLKYLGKNVNDTVASKIFAEAGNMLKIAMEAKDSKTKTKLQQIDLMLKKARLDKETNNVRTDSSKNIFNRNDLLEIIKQKDK